MPASSNSFPEVVIENITQFLASQEARALGVATLVTPTLYGETLKILNEDENVDMLLAISDPGRPCIHSILEATEIIN